MKNWYIDFDSTLYNTNALIDDMLETIANYISYERNIDHSNIVKEINGMFDKDHTYNIFEVCGNLEKKYKLGKNALSNQVKNILDDGLKYIYNDVTPFLDKLLTNSENKLHILTKTNGKTGMYFQQKKVSGSGITQYFDTVIYSSISKSEVNLKYESGVFVDDVPKECESFYEAGAYKVYRLRRPNDRYSNQNLDNGNIKEYTTLLDIVSKEDIV